MEKFIGWKRKKPTSFSLVAITLDWVRQVTVNHMQVFLLILLKKRIQYPNAPDLKVSKAGLWCRVTIADGPIPVAGVADNPCTRRIGRAVIQKIKSNSEIKNCNNN